MLYNAALEIRALHALMHVSFVVSAAVGWWPIMSPLPELPRLALPLQMLYVLVLGAPMVVVAALITLAPTPLYPHYTAAPRLWGIDALADQRAGGVIMWVPGHVVFVVPFTLAFFRWAREESEEDDTGPVEHSGPP
jgi:putative membrane protein